MKNIQYLNILPTYSRGAAPFTNQQKCALRPFKNIVITYEPKHYKN